MTKQQRAKWNTTRVAYEQKREQIRQRLKRFENMGLRFKAAPKRPLKRITKASVRRLERYNEYLDTIYEKQTGKKPPKPNKPNTQTRTKPIKKTKPTKSIKNTQPTKSIIQQSFTKPQEENENIPSMAASFERKVENILSSMQVVYKYGNECSNGIDWQQAPDWNGSAKLDWERWKTTTSDKEKAAIMEKYSNEQIEDALLWQSYGSDSVELFTNQNKFMELLNTLKINIDEHIDELLDSH